MSRRLEMMQSSRKSMCPAPTVPARDHTSGQKQRLWLKAQGERGGGGQGAPEEAVTQGLRDFNVGLNVGGEKEGPAGSEGQQGRKPTAHLSSPARSGSLSPSEGPCVHPNMA